MKKTMRVNKYLQAAGLCSRRAADDMIREGRVTVDGRTAVLGELIDDGMLVCVDGKLIAVTDEHRVVLAFNKPAGIVCTEDKREPDNVIDFLQYPKRVTYAGRLDKNSEGLLIMTGDGELIERMMRGRNAHEKEYEVTVDRDLHSDDLENMACGVPIAIEARSGQTETVTTRPCKIEQTGARTFRIVLTQGLNRQIRKMCARFGYEVVQLKRVRVMNIRLGDLAPGQWREVTREELDELMQILEQSK